MRAPRPRARPGRRRRVLLGATGLAIGEVALTGLAPRSAQADPRDALLAQTIRNFVGSGSRVLASTRLQLEIDPLVENGNSVPVRVRVQSSMTPSDHVTRILILAPRNPQPQVAVFHLGPHSGRAEVATRFRMAESQTVLALAHCSDGTVHEARAEVIVTLAACLET